MCCAGTTEVLRSISYVQYSIFKWHVNEIENFIAAAESARESPNTIGNGHGVHYTIPLYSNRIKYAVYIPIMTTRKCQLIIIII